MITPKDIEKQQFEVAFRGYSSREVDEFLNRVTAELAEMIATEEHLRKKVAAAELIAKDAKDHEEEFIASMEADRAEATAILESARVEGEKIIRDAKRAASGIMSEVHRRASEISRESKRAVEAMETEGQIRANDITSAAERRAEETVATAERRAEEIVAAANAEAERVLFTARTEADNVISAAEIRARAAVNDAKAESDALISQANSAASLCEDYMNRIREEAKLLCLELDTELRNSAARITILGRRIAETPEPAPAPVTVITPAAPAVPVEKPVAAVDDTPVIPAEEHAAVTSPIDDPTDFDNADDPYTVTDSYDIGDEGLHFMSSENADTAGAAVTSPAGGYFTEEYRKVMAELFGEDVDLSGSSSGDDDTYDYLDRVTDSSSNSDSDDIDTAISFRRVNMGDGSDDEGSGDYVSGEYSGLSGDGDDVLDIFSSSTIDKVFKSPSDDDISDIMSNY